MERSVSAHILFTRTRDSCDVSRLSPPVADSLFSSPCFVGGFSSSGTKLAAVDYQGLRVLNTNDFREIYRARRQNIQYVSFSPCERYVVTYEKFTEGDNLFIWSLSQPQPVYAFTKRKINKPDWPLIKWAEDGSMFLYKSNEVIEMYRLNSGNPVSLITDEVVSSYSLGAKLPGKVITFMGEVKAEKAKACLYFIENNNFRLVTDFRFTKAQEAAVLWNAQETAALLWCQTDVDTTGRSYYGEHSLQILSEKGGKNVKTEEGPIYDVAWSPVGDEFIVISGYMPAKSVLYNSAGNKKTQIAQHHRNTIRWNKAGDLFILAGFGNLQGDIEIWQRNPLQQVGSCKNHSTVACEWAPCGRIFISAVLTPRMRVDNGYTINRYTGEAVYSINTDGELWQIEWLPNYSEFKPEPIIVTEKAAKAEEKKVYRPPGSTSDFAARFKAMKNSSAVPKARNAPAETAGIPGLEEPSNKKKRKKKKKTEEQKET